MSRRRRHTHFCSQTLSSSRHMQGGKPPTTVQGSRQTHPSSLGCVVCVVRTQGPLCRGECSPWWAWWVEEEGGGGWWARCHSG
jgi:hypothetical protein